MNPSQEEQMTSQSPTPTQATARAEGQADFDAIETPVATEGPVSIAVRINAATTETSASTEAEGKANSAATETSQSIRILVRIDYDFEWRHQYVRITPGLLGGSNINLTYDDPVDFNRPPGDKPLRGLKLAVKGLALRSIVGFAFRVHSVAQVDPVDAFERRANFHVQVPNAINELLDGFRNQLGYQANVTTDTIIGTTPALRSFPLLMKWQGRPFSLQEFLRSFVLWVDLTVAQEIEPGILKEDLLRRCEFDIVLPTLTTTPAFLRRYGVDFNHAIRSGDLDPALIVGALWGVGQTMVYPRDQHRVVTKDYFLKNID